MDEEFFNRKCPYNDKPCHDFHCMICQVEKEEREWMEEMAKEESKYEELWEEE